MRLLLMPLVGCSTVHGVRPLGAGNLALDASLGGPVTELYGAPLPLPLSTVGVTYGIDDRTDVHGAIHPTPTLLFGLVAADAGVSRLFVEPKGPRPRVMGDLTLVGAAGDTEPGDPAGGIRLWIQPTLVGSWDWGTEKRQTFYADVGLFLEPYPGPAALPWLGIGEWWGVGERFHLTTELKWIAPTTSSRTLAPTYYSPGSVGAVSFQLGASYTIGGVR